MSSIHTTKAVSVQLIEEDQFAKPSCLKRSGWKNEVFHQMISWIIWNGSKGAWNLLLEALKCLRGLKAAGYSRALPSLPMTNLAGFASIKSPFVTLAPGILG